MISACTFKKAIHYTPARYVAYVNGPMVVAADRIFLFWDNNDRKWFYPFSAQTYRDHVYGWIGPLPVLKLQDEKQQDEEAADQ